MPGTTSLPRRSMPRVVCNFSRSTVFPTATIRFPRIATASAKGPPVKKRPFIRTRSTGPRGFSERQATARSAMARSRFMWTRQFILRSEATKDLAALAIFSCKAARSFAALRINDSRYPPRSSRGPGRRRHREVAIEKIERLLRGDGFAGSSPRLMHVRVVDSGDNDAAVQIDDARRGEARE